MTYCTEQQRHTDTHMHTHAHMWNHTTHRHQGAQADGFGTSKASQGLMKCEATRRRSKLFSFPYHAEGGDTPTLHFPIWHFLTGEPTELLEKHTHTGRGGKGGERKWCISFGMMNTVNREKRRLKNRLWGEPIKGCAQMVNTLWCKAELIKVRGSGSLHFFSLGWNDFVFHLAAANPVWFDWPR